MLCELLACCVEALTPAGPLTMATVLDQPAVWCGLCSWHVAFDAAKPTGAAKPPGAAVSYADSCAALAAAAATVGRALRAGGKLRDCPLGNLKRYQEDGIWSQLRRGWEALGAPVTRDELMAAAEAAAEAWALLQTVRAVALHYAAPDSELLRHALVIEGGWHKSSLDDVQSFLRLGPHDLAAEPAPPGPVRAFSKGGTRHDLRPLPAALLGALGWLHAMSGSKLLSAVWAKAEAKAAAELDEGDAVAAAAAALGIADAPAEGDGEEEAAAEEVDVEKAAEVEERRLLRTLAALRELWVVLYTGVSDGSVKLTELANLAPLLLDSTERQLLVASARGLQAVGGGGGGGGGGGSAVEEWPMLSGELDAATVANLFRFGHVLAVKGALPSIAEALRLLQRWVAADARESVNKVAVAVGRLGALVNAQWATATFADAGAFAAEADIVDERLVSVDPSLLLTLQDADSLLGWLRLTPNDNDFTSSIELALGRSEMECPDELWSREQRSVDESILSKLSGVRAFLHDHLYAGGDAELYTNLSAALDVVGRWDWAAAPTIAKSVRECSDVRLALQELLAGDSDSAAPGRLMQLAKLRARWRCSSEPPPESSTIGAAATDAAAVAAAAAEEAAEAAEGGGGGDDEAHLWLEYMLMRGGVEHRVVQQMTEVVEFQSAVVLSGQTRHGDVGARVDSFVVQFGLVQLLRETLAELKAAGHFGYATFSVEYSLDVAPDEIQAAVRAARASLAWWASAVARARDTHYHLNFYTLRQLAPLRAFLECSDGDPNAIMAELVRLVNPDMGDEQLRAIALDLTRAWDESGGDGAPDAVLAEATAADVAAARDLGRLGAALDRALGAAAPAPPHGRGGGGRRATGERRAADVRRGRRDGGRVAAVDVPAARRAARARGVPAVLEGDRRGGARQFGAPLAACVRARPRGPTLRDWRR